jgi:hypothetical protein
LRIEEADIPKRSLYIFHLENFKCRMNLTDVCVFFVFFSVSKRQCKPSITQMARFFNSYERRRVVVRIPDYHSAVFSCGSCDSDIEDAEILNTSYETTAIFTKPLPTHLS